MTKLQDLNDKMPIVNSDGTPTPYFMRLLQDRGILQGDDHTVLTDLLAKEVVPAAVPHPGIAVTNGLLGNPGNIELSVEISDALDQLLTTRGAVIYRGAAGWVGLAPGTSGYALKTQGAGADPIWSAVTADIQTLLDGISTTQGVIIYYDGTDWVALNPGTAGYLLATGGAGASPSWTAPPSGNIQTLLDGISTTQGVILYYNGTDWVALAPGTAGQALVTGGAGADPSWSSVSLANLGISSAKTSTNESTSSTAYVNLTTTGPSVTLTTGTEVLISIHCLAGKTSAGAGNSAFIAVDVSGATTIAATDANGASVSAPGQSYNLTLARTFKLTGLTPGSNTFTLKYRVDGGTFAFADRDIVVTPLGLTTNTPTGGGLELIEEYTGTSSGGAKTFTVPAGYSDVVFELAGRVDSAGSALIGVTVNGLTTAIYDSQRQYALNTTPSGDQGLGQTSWAAPFNLPGTSTAAGDVGGGTLELLDYAGTTFNKMFVCLSRQPNSTTTHDQYVVQTVGQARLTGAITSVTFTPAGGANFLTGTKIRMYGRGGIAGVGAGSVFPTSPVTNQRYFRTDRGIEYYYDGTRWLSTQLFTMNAGGAFNEAVSKYSYLMIPQLTSYSVYLEKLESTTFRGGAGEWDVVLVRFDSANAETTVATIDGNGDAANTWINKSAAINAVLDASAKGVKVHYSLISGTAPLYGNATLSYRLVG